MTGMLIIMHLQDFTRGNYAFGSTIVLFLLLLNIHNFKLIFAVLNL